MKKLTWSIITLAWGFGLFWQSAQIATATRVRQEMAPIDCGENQCCGGGRGEGFIFEPPPVCPPAPVGYQMINPGIPSGSRCRGACGEDCDPDACTVQPQITKCYGNSSVHIWCTYNVIECGSHQACRTHDECYDNCVAILPPDEVSNCKFGCDLQCLDDWDDLDCAAWATGGGPQPDRLRYVGAPSASDLYEGRCL